MGATERVSPAHVFTLAHRRGLNPSLAQRGLMIGAPVKLGAKSKVFQFSLPDREPPTNLLHKVTMCPIACRTNFGPRGPLFTWLLSVAVAVNVTALAQHHTRSPRGYCAPISRVVSPRSLCHDHLVAAKAHRSGQASSGIAANQEDVGEELVYVRLETSGANISNLSTSAINEHLLVGVLSRLFGFKQSQQEPGRGPATGPSLGPEAAPIIGALQAQIFDSAQGQTEAGRLASRCREAIERLVCRLVYPTCHFRRKDVSALVRPPCREDCLLARDLFCPNVNWPNLNLALNWAFNTSLGANLSPLGLQADGELGPTQTKLDSSSIHFYWPHEHSIEHCEVLPPLRPLHTKRLDRKTSGIDEPRANELHEFNMKHNRDIWRWPICSNAYLTSTPVRIPRRSDCIDAEGVYEYLGQVNRTKSGLVCQHWHDQQPHKHSR